MRKAENCKPSLPSHSAADPSLDTELEEFADSTATLSQALTSRQRLLTTDVEEVCVKFDDSIS
jgi:hypothetical protein